MARRKRITWAKFLDLLSAYRGKFGIDEEGAIRAQVGDREYCPLQVVFGGDGDIGDDPRYGYVSSTRSVATFDPYKVIYAADQPLNPHRPDLLRALGL